MTNSSNGCNHVARKAGNRYSKTRVCLDVMPLVAQLRLVKDEQEISSLRKAISVSCQAHLAVMKRAKPALYEYQLENTFLTTLGEAGCRSVGYPSIVAAGHNACVLHYIDNKSQLEDNDLLLIDAGAEVDGYSADITRTYPVGRRFTVEQSTERLYWMCKASVELVKVGSDFGQLNSVPYERFQNT